MLDLKGLLEQSKGVREIVDSELKRLLEEQFSREQFPHIWHHMRLDQLGVGKEDVLYSNKRLRCVLFLIIAESMGVPRDDALAVACALEIYHCASLAIDDLQDGDQDRCGRKALWAEMGEKMAINAAFLLMQAADRMIMEFLLKPQGAGEGFFFRAFDSLKRTAISMAAGQSLDLCAKDLWPSGIKGYLEIVGGKSAALIATVCEIATFYRCGEDDIRTLRDLGFAFGVLLQVADDADDLTVEGKGLDPSNVAFFWSQNKTLKPDRQSFGRSCAKSMKNVLQMLMTN
ncbi:MAG: polyprenyl synthetase family protein [Candidatus Buchananbacteria bacterium]